MTQVVVLLSGLPGTGKTRLAMGVSKRLGIPSLSKDRFQSRLRALNLTGREGAEGYELMFDVADQQLALGLGVVLDAVFPLGGFRDRARALAERRAARFRPILCVCSDPPRHKARLTDRDKLVPNWTPVGREEVQKIREYFEVWPAGSALVLDCLDDYESNLENAVEWIEGSSGLGK